MLKLNLILCVVGLYVVTQHDDVSARTIDEMIRDSASDSREH